MGVGMMMLMTVPFPKEMDMGMTTLAGKPLPEHPEPHRQDNPGGD